MNLVDAQTILSAIRFPGYRFEIYGNFDAEVSHTYLQAVFHAPDNTAPGNTTEQRTRKWILSPHMTRSELVQTAFKCVLSSLEHEAREQFTYKGERLFSPHYDVEDLVRLCRLGMADAGARS